MFYEQDYIERNYSDNGRKIYEMQKEDTLCDVTLRIDGQKFRTHRLMLAAASPFFRTMFTINMKESNQDEIELHDINSCIFEQLLMFIYTGEITIDEDNAQELLMASNFYQIHKVRERSCRFLQNKVQIDTVLDMWEFAKNQDCHELIKTCLIFIDQNFCEVVKLNEFQSLSKEAIVSLLAREELEIKSEEQILSAALVWLNADMETRSKFARELIVLVRLPLLSPKDLAQANELFNSMECMDLFEKALEYQNNPKSRLENHIFETKIRSGNFRSEVFVLGYRRNPDYVTFKLYNDTYSIHRECDLMPPEKFRKEAVLIEHDSCIYSIGGYVINEGFPRIKTENRKPCDENSNCTCDECDYRYREDDDKDVYKPLEQYDPYRTVEKFNPESNVWTRSAPMLCYRRFSSAVSFAGALFVFGGEDSDQYPLNTAEMYDQGSNKWTEIANMNVARIKHASVVSLGLVYVIGGERRHPNEHKRKVCLKHKSCMCFALDTWKKTNEEFEPFIRSVELYNMQTDRWSVGEPFLENRKSLSAASLHGRIYIAGISFSTFPQYTAECFDPVSCSWTSLEPFRYLTNVNHACRLLIFNGKLCAFGCNIICYEYFCFETSLWNTKYNTHFYLTDYDHVYYGVMTVM